MEEVKVHRLVKHRTLMQVMDVLVLRNQNSKSEYLDLSSYINFCAELNLRHYYHYFIV